MTHSFSGSYVLLAVILAMLAMFLPLTVDGSIPIIPEIAHHFGASSSNAQFTLSAVVLGIAVGQLVYGPLSDRFGRKPVILAGVLLYIVAAMACTMVSSIEILILIRFLQGCFACAGIIVARAIIRDLFNRESGARLFSLMMSIHGVMPAAAPGFCGWVGQSWGWETVFLVMAAFGGCTFLAVVFGLAESNRQPDSGATNPVAMLQTYGRILGHPVFRAYVSCACFAYACLFAYFAGAPIGLIQYLALEPSEYGVAMAVPMLAYIATQFMVFRIITRLGMARTLGTGIILLLLSGVSAVTIVITGAVTVYSLIAAVVVLMMAIAFITPVTTAGAIAPFPHNAGAASSLLGFLQFLAASLVTAGIGLFSDGTPWPMACALLSCAAGAAIVWLARVRRATGTSGS